MNTYGVKGSGLMGATNILGMPLGVSDDLQRTTFLNRLENAVSRLDRTAEQVVGNASTLTGGWPTEGRTANAKDAPASAGLLGAVEDIASTIHRICDQMEEANRAVSDRLP